jgi:hypothetical protein
VREKEGRRLQAQIDQFKATLSTLAKENEAAQKGLAELALKKQELQVGIIHPLSRHAIHPSIHPSIPSPGTPSHRRFPRDGM